MSKNNTSDSADKRKNILSARFDDLKFSMRDPAQLTAVISVSVVVIMFIIIPLFTILKESVLSGKKFSLQAYTSIFKNAYDLGIISNTLILGIVVALLGTVVAFIFAYATTYLAIPHKRIFKIFSILPMVSPPFVISLAFILLFGRSGLITYKLLGIRPDIYGFWGLAFTQVLSFFPTGYLMLTAMLQNIDPSIEEAACISGAGMKKVFSSITIPLIRPVFFSSLVYAFIRGMTLVSTIIFLVSAKWQMLTVAIMNQVDQGLYGAANAYCLVLIAIVALFMSIMYLFMKKMGINLDEGY